LARTAASRWRPLDGYELDFAAETLRGRFDIEVDGVHYRDRFGHSRRPDIARDRALEASGRTVIRVQTWRIAMSLDDVVGEIVDRVR
jgi:very-short-patch-repair endonuclease